MKVTIVAIGTRGDTQPFIALGHRLVSRGHDVRLVCAGNFTALAEEAGLEAVPLSYDPNEILGSPRGQRVLSSGRNLLKLAWHSVRLAKPYLERDTVVLAEACTGADAVIYSTIGFSAHHVAERDGTWNCHAQVQPIEPTRDFPPMQVPFGLGPLGNRIAHEAAEQIMWHAFRAFINEWRTREAGLPAAPFFGPYRALRRARTPVLCGFSDAMIPRGRDWGDNVKVTGFWFYDPPSTWTPPQDLVDFIGDGPAPVYAGFGSMVPGDLADTDRLLRAALRKSGQRGVLLGNPQGLPNDDQFFTVTDVPHTWLIPQMAAAVHHGGIGTTSGCLRAGVPNVVAAFFHDQPYFGQRVHELGAGPKPLWYQKLTVPDLAERITQAVTSPRMKERAMEIGARIHAEDGAGTAADHVESWVANHQRG
ncbi:MULTISPECIES: glycosyltransferase [Actinomadura]|uniref:Glycosyltransferase n=1 Tax=Actinomadura yumaensis TaxID=111807 RepID=A0ABW2CEQ1_9ACTN|nr:glycosyltransferase [Actinomadura sp. J1-007]MWK34429.1 glycosyltransferase [Actinomadura sp. J1-007]